MFLHQGIWLPDGEMHFPQWMDKNGELVDGKGTYQIRKFREAMKWCRGFGTAIDVGAHVGLWSMQLVKRFRDVFAYEPVPQFRECFVKNVRAPIYGVHDWELSHYALGRAEGRVRMAIDPADTGGTHVAKGAGNTPMRTLDAEFLPLEGAVDFIKLDCEGYELEVLAGGEALLRTAKPTVIVEQKPHKLGPNFGITGTPAVDFLKKLGYTVRREMGGDYILTAGDEDRPHPKARA